jgi:hypothetical protein
LASFRYRRGAQRPWLAIMVVLGALSLTYSRPALAQSVHNRIENDFGDLLRILSDVVTQISTKSRGEALSFLNRIELFNVEDEIDRLVGNPWELSDSTSYKLSLAPLHIAYPVFDQMVRQMTRLDDIRSRRIQNLTVDSLGLIAVDLDILSAERSGSQLADSILHYFNAREFLDLGVFMLAQQPFFPDTEEGWNFRKRQIAGHEGALALSAAGLGAMFEVGALSNSGTIKRCPDQRCRVGWYGSFSHLGYHLQPNLRGGITTELPWLEFSAGLMEQVRPASDAAGSVFELAVRESWLNRYTSVSGWNSFAEAAVRRVLSTESAYRGEDLTARGGLFVKREHPFRLRYITLRNSFEVESDLTGSLRYAMGLGIDYTKTGLSTVLQSSRTNFTHADGPEPETRTGLFVAGTVESPEQYYVEAMNVEARLAREEWHRLEESETQRRQAEAKLRVLAGAQTPLYRLAPVFEVIRKSSAESEARRARLATLLGDYLESRRIAYSLKQWHRGSDELYGPLDGELLRQASASVVSRLAELTLFLRAAVPRLEALRARYLRTNESLVWTDSPSEALVASATRELSEIDRAWRSDSEAVTDGLRLYEHYLGCVRRMAGIASTLVGARDTEPIDQRTMRKLIVLTAQPLQ